MIYHYTTLNGNGNKEEGDIEATSIDSAILLLQKQGKTTILEVKEKVDTQTNVIAFAAQKFSKQKIKQKSQI